MVLRPTAPPGETLLGEAESNGLGRGRPGVPGGGASARRWQPRPPVRTRGGTGHRLLRGHGPCRGTAEAPWPPRPVGSPPRAGLWGWAGPGPLVPMEVCPAPCPGGAPWPQTPGVGRLPAVGPTQRLLSELPHTMACHPHTGPHRASCGAAGPSTCKPLAPGWRGMAAGLRVVFQPTRRQSRGCAALASPPAARPPGSGRGCWQSPRAAQRFYSALSLQPLQPLQVLRGGTLPGAGTRSPGAGAPGNRTHVSESSRPFLGQRAGQAPWSQQGRAPSCPPRALLLRVRAGAQGAGPGAGPSPGRSVAAPGWPPPRCRV